MLAAGPESTQNHDAQQLGALQPAAQLAPA
jgi:hypothetical protein